MNLDAQLTGSISRVLVKAITLHPTAEPRAATGESGTAIHTIGSHHQGTAIGEDPGALPCDSWGVYTPLGTLTSTQLLLKRMTRLCGKSGS